MKPLIQLRRELADTYLGCTGCALRKVGTPVVETLTTPPLRCGVPIFPCARGITSANVSTIYVAHHPDTRSTDRLTSLTPGVVAV
jgi:hypothetical protein